MTVYCYDLVPLRTQTNWTRAMDDWLRAEYFPGLSITMVAVAARERFGNFKGLTDLNVLRRLETLGLYSRRKARREC